MDLSEDRRHVVDRRAEFTRPTRVELEPPRSRVSWSGVWGGFLLALGIWIVLAALGAAVGLSTLSPGTNLNLASFTSGSFIWMYIAALIALFFGGVFGARLAMIVDGAIAWLEASLIWVFALVLTTAVATFLASTVLTHSVTAQAVFSEAPQINADLASRDVPDLLNRLNDPKTVDAFATMSGLPRDQVQSSLASIRERVAANRTDPAAAVREARDGLTNLTAQARANGNTVVQRSVPGSAKAAWMTFIGIVIAWIVTVVGSFWGRAQAAGRARELGLAA